VLLKKVRALESMDNQKLFSQESAIFVCNQWDKVSKYSISDAYKHLASGHPDYFEGIEADLTATALLGASTDLRI
jgi:hypothetical protein